MNGLHKSLVRQGLGEIFKIAVIKSRKLFDILSEKKLALKMSPFTGPIVVFICNLVLSLC